MFIIIDQRCKRFPETFNNIFSSKPNTLLHYYNPLADYSGGVNEYNCNVMHVIFHI